MHIRHLLTSAAIAGAFCLAAATSYANGVSTEDFVRQASVANRFEIDSSKLALDKTQNSGVKQFAQRMIADHTKVGDQFKKALKSSKTKAQPAEALDDKHQQLLSELQSVPASRFDSRYIAMQTDAHTEAVSLFGDYAKTGKDSTLRDFAARTLPILQRHLAHVRKLKATQ